MKSWIQRKYQQIRGATRRKKCKSCSCVRTRCLSLTTAHTTLIQILKKNYLYEQLYDGLKMEGAKVIRRVGAFAGFTKNDCFTDLVKQPFLMKHY